LLLEISSTRMPPSTGYLANSPYHEQSGWPLPNGVLVKWHSDSLRTPCLRNRIGEDAGVARSSEGKSLRRAAPCTLQKASGAVLDRTKFLLSTRT
jgi:hypothetical protein